MEKLILKYVFAVDVLVFGAALYSTLTDGLTSLLFVSMCAALASGLLVWASYPRLTTPD